MKKTSNPQYDIKEYKGEGLMFYNAVATSGIPKEKVRELMHVSDGTFYGLYKKEVIKDVYKRGLASVLNRSVDDIFRTEQPEPEKVKRKIPLMGEGAAGGDMEINVTEDSAYVGEYIDIGDMLKDSEAAFTVYGNSMTPAYPPGCLVGVKRNYDGFIQPGETYLIVTKSNRVFKRLYYAKDGSGYTAYSDNTLTYESGPLKGEYCYPTFPIKKADIISIFDVTGMIKRNRNSGIIQRQK